MIVREDKAYRVKGFTITDMDGNNVDTGEVVTSTDLDLSPLVTFATEFKVAFTIVAKNMDKLSKAIARLLGSINRNRSSQQQCAKRSNRTRKKQRLTRLQRRQRRQSKRR